MTKAKRMRLRDAEAMARRHPDTFDAADTDMLELGMLVKVASASNGERFWVELTSVGTTKLRGRVRNDIEHRRVGFDDLIEFERRHVYEVDRCTP